MPRVTDHDLVRTPDGLLVKRYRHNDHPMARREWRALTLLHEYEPGLAPEPISVDLDAHRPSITMSILPGDALGDHPLSPPEVGAIAAALDRLHTCVPDKVLADVPPASDDPQQVVGSIAGRLAAQPRPDGDAVITRAYDEALRWLAGPDAKRLVTDEPETPVLARGDHNLTNFLWDGERTRLVDFEYAGRSDRCAEIADLVEHISARITPDETWRQLLEQWDFSPAERRRVQMVRRLYSMVWLLLLLPGQGGEKRNPPGTLRKQAERTLQLLNA